MKILITGAGGFVGSHLIRALAGEGRHDVLGVTLHGTRLSVAGYRDLQLDLAVPTFPSLLPSSADLVIHLAQSAGYRNFPSSATDLFAVNVDSTFRLLEWSRTHGARGFWLASTGNVYRPSTGELKETDPCEPTSFYGASKLAAETLTRQYASVFETTILRICGVYGPGQRNMLIPDMIQRIRTGGEITLAGDRGIVFTPIYIDDCVELLRRLVDMSGGGASGVFNLGGCETVDLKGIVTILGRHLRLTPNTRCTDAPATYFVGDSRKLYSQVGFRPLVGLERGLAQTVHPVEDGA